MDILFCTSEAYPLIKTGGLADVSGSLPKALHALGNDVRIILPAYPDAVKRAGELATVGSLSITGTDEPVDILQGRFPETDIIVYLVDSPAHFNRAGNPYIREDGNDWPDNAERFALFARAIVEVATGQAGTGWSPELVHCNDWQTGLVPALLSKHDVRPTTVFTIHNLAYQGLFPAETFSALQLPDTLWSIDGLEFHNMLSFLKGGIANADWVTTVSPTYAQEICTTEFGYGLEGLLTYRSDRLTGIVNGMDTDVWNPATDRYIDRNYDVHSLQHKAFNKFALQRETGLPVGSHNMMLGHIGRLVEQKGSDLILDILDELFQHPIQMVILGDGNREFEQQLLQASRRYPQQLAVHIGYNEPLAHRIEAGSDCFLMPSRYEPCGLNQMYSLRYGTVPIVRNTGGLADTVVDLSEETARNYTATGFTIKEESADAVLDACLRAFSYFRPPQVDWWKLVLTGMKEDFSWANRAQQYMDLYHKARTSRLVEARENEDSDFKALPGSVSGQASAQDTTFH